MLTRGGPNLFLMAADGSNERAAFVADVIERANVRMVQRCDGAGFTIETLAQVWGIDQGSRHYFECDGPIEPRVARAVHLAHTARAERGQDFVRSEAPAVCEGQVAAIIIAIAEVTVLDIPNAPEEN